MSRLLRPVLVALVLLVAAVVARRPAEPAPEPLAVAREGPKWFKGNLHTHSLWSDGDDFPEMIADWYKRKGYHFLGLSDHNVLSDGERWLTVKEKGTHKVALDKYKARFGPAWVEERTVKDARQVRLKPLGEFRSMLEEAGKFLMVQAEEVTHSYSKAPVHINAINLRDVIKPADGKSVAETIAVNARQIAEQGRKKGRPVLAFLNHPNFGWGVRAEDMIAAEELRFFEVYNGHTGVRNEGDATHPSSERLWDIALSVRLGKKRGGLIYGLGTDDSHGYHAFGAGKQNPGRGWVVVRAPYLSAEAIVKAMDAGDFYASTGVVLDDIKAAKGEYRVRVREEKGVTYRVDFVGTRKGASLESSARLDKDEKPLPVSRVYSDDVGKVLATVNGPEAVYKPTGDEWYVRARVASTKPHPNPYRKGDVEMAWGQPVAVQE